MSVTEVATETGVQNNEEDGAASVAEFTLCPQGTRWCREHSPEGCLSAAIAVADKVTAWLRDPQGGGRAVLVVEDAAAGLTEIVVQVETAEAG